jgi:hypothetical protein
VSTAAVIEAVCARLDTHYVFPEVAARVVTVLRRRLAEGAYAGLDDRTLADVVTVDLQSINGDKHLRLRHHPDVIPDTEDEWGEEEERCEAELSGYGIARSERLPGNVGYLDTRMFHSPEVAGAAYEAAMTLLAGTDALLVDLRRNRGGSPGTVALLCSYLLDERTRLTDIYFREGDRLEQMWTLPYVPGRRFGGSKPVWLLVGPDTFSGAEDLAYTLQQLGRALVVGEVTRGGAHPRGQYKVGEHLDVTVSYARSINQISGTNWEGTGVLPDVNMPAADAFAHAYRSALEHVMGLGEVGVRRGVAEEAIMALATL